MNQDLYENLCNAKIKESIFLCTKLILKDVQDFDKTFEIIVNTFASTLSYIASFIAVYEVRIWLNACDELIALIESEKIVMKDVYRLICKMCILCDIYLKNPVSKTGIINVKLLRPKVIDMFVGHNFKLTDIGMSKFEGILPPADSPSYSLALQIITGYVFAIKDIDNLSVDNDADKISDLANKIRKSVDYIIRKKYAFETKFYETDSDAVWFLWGLISMLYQDRELDILYQLFNVGYNKKSKNGRVGFLWGAALSMVYIKKRDICRNWNQKEIQVIKKVEEISLKLYNNIKKELISSNEIQEDLNKPVNIDGLEYILGIRHQVSETVQNEIPANPSNDDIKLIKYKKMIH